MLASHITYNNEQRKIVRISGKYSLQTYEISIMILTLNNRLHSNLKWNLLQSRQSLHAQIFSKETVGVNIHQEILFLTKDIVTFAV